MKRRDFIRITIGSIAAMGCGVSLAAPKESPKPNVVFILADDLRADCIGAVNPLIKTPNIDRLAKRGVLFNNCYNMGANGAGVCQPSRTMIMSGRHLYHLPNDSTAHSGDKPSVPVLPTVFRKAGYDSLFCGKTENTYPRANNAFDQLAIRNIKHGEQDYDRAVRARRGYAKPVVSYLADPARANKPFFAYYAPCTPHDPLFSEPECDKLYKGENRPPLPVSASVNHTAFAGFELKDTNARPYDVPGLGRFKTPLNLSQWRDINAKYYAMVSSFDRDVGLILDELERTGAIKNTIIVFSSDNGHSHSDHGQIHKSSLYEHDIKLPLIVCGPGIAEGKRSDAFVYISDILPTLCEMIDTPIPETVQTKSFLPNITDPGKSGRKTLSFGYTEEIRAFRDEQYKIVLYSNKYAQLFDLKADPNESRNLAKDPAFAKRLASMIEKARAEDKAWGDCEDKKIANIWRPWPMKPCRLKKDGPMFWEIWADRK
ncbi:MAG: sulfatase-like hydrolase/transferase [Mariniblastus sp.]|nr:sulfatase-like hydrolase/transferase [Mariniblastus sp.]